MKKWNTFTECFQHQDHIFCLLIMGWPYQHIGFSHESTELSKSLLGQIIHGFCIDFVHLKCSVLWECQYTSHSSKWIISWDSWCLWMHFLHECRIYINKCWISVISDSFNTFFVPFDKTTANVKYISHFKLSFNKPGVLC